jgi:hypothetical protein
MLLRTAERNSSQTAELVFRKERNRGFTDGHNRITVGPSFSTTRRCYGCGSIQQLPGDGCIVPDKTGESGLGQDQAGHSIGVQIRTAEHRAGAERARRLRVQRKGTALEDELPVAAGGPARPAGARRRGRNCEKRAHRETRQPGRHRCARGSRRVRSDRLSVRIREELQQLFLLEEQVDVREKQGVVVFLS